MTDALKNWRRDLKNVQYDEIETQIRDATCNTNEQPSSDLVSRIAAGMCDRNKYRLAWLMLWKRAVDEKVPKHVSKALGMIDFLLRVNPPSLQVQVWLVQNLKEFEHAQYLTKLRQGEGVGGLGMICETAKTIWKFVIEFKEPDPSVLTVDPTRMSTESPRATPGSPITSFGTVIYNSPKPYSPHGSPQAVIHNLPTPYSPYGPPGALLFNAPTPYNPDSPPSPSHIIHTTPIFSPYKPRNGSPVVTPQPWTCAMCTFVNQPISSVCDVCAFVKPAEAVSPIAGYGTPAVKPSAGYGASPGMQSSNNFGFTPSLGHSSSSVGISTPTHASHQATSSSYVSPNQGVQQLQQQQLQQQLQQQQLQQLQQQHERWDCPRCKFFNSGIDVVCKTCFGPRPVPAPVPAPVPPPVSPMSHAMPASPISTPAVGRTWTCSMCRHANKETAASCAHCWCSRPIDVVYNTPDMVSGYGNTSHRIAGIITANLASATARQSLGPLPMGWEERIDPRINRSYFVNHAKSITTWDDPRPARVAPADAGPPAYEESAASQPTMGATAQQPAPRPSTTNATKQAWVCSICTAHNTAENVKCEICDGPRTGNEPAPPEEKAKATPAPASSFASPSIASGLAESWACALCSFVNTLSKYQSKCEICDGPRPPIPPKKEEVKVKEEAKVKVDGWECDWCCTVNDLNQSHCQLCFSTKPNSNDKVTGGGRDTADIPMNTNGASDPPMNLQRSATLWQCSRCCHTSEYVQCRVCGQPEPKPAAVAVEANLTIQKPVATLTSVAYSGGSWQCSFCDVINNAKKEECRICSRSRAIAAVVEPPPQMTVPAAVPASAVSDPFAGLDGFGSSTSSTISSTSASSEPPRAAGELSRKYSAPPPFSPLLFTENSSSSYHPSVSASSPVPVFAPPPAGPPPAHLLAKASQDIKSSLSSPSPSAITTTSSSSSSSTSTHTTSTTSTTSISSLSSDVKHFFAKSLPSFTTISEHNKSSSSSSSSSEVTQHQITSPTPETRTLGSPLRKYSGIAPPPPPPTPVEKGVEDLDQAAKIRAEIYATEQTYVFNLTRLLTVFIRPINQKSKSFGLSQAQTVDLCGNISVIARLHTLLVQDMQKEDMVEVLLKNADFLKIYTSYVNNYEKMIATITLLSKNKNFEKFLAETEREQMSLPSYLIMPIQRIPRYCLLLRELQKNTSDEAANYPRLCLALEKLKAIAACINEQKRKFENTSQLLDIQTRIRAPAHYLVLKPNRSFVRQGKLKRVDDDMHYYFFLFSDALLQTTDKYKVVQEMNINTLTVQARSVDTVLFTILQQQHKGKVFEFNLLAEVGAERDAWVSDLQTAIGQSNPAHLGVSQAQAGGNPEAPYEVILEGVLQKRSPKNNRYQERYFELLPTVLIYRKRKGAAERSGELRIRDVSAVRNIEQADKKGGEFELDVRSVGDADIRKYGTWRTFNLQANTGAEATKWMQAIQKQVQANAVAAEEPEDAPPLLQSSGGSLAQLRSQANVIRSGWMMVRNSGSTNTQSSGKKLSGVYVKRYVVLTPAQCALYVSLENAQAGAEKAEVTLSLSSTSILLPLLPKGNVAKEESSWGLECGEQKIDFELCVDEREELPNLSPNNVHVYVAEPDISRRKENWLHDFRVSIPSTVFGVSLELAAKRSDPTAKIPAPLTIALKWLDERGLEEQGLYRVPGSKTEVDSLIAQFDRGETVRIPDQYSGNNLASLVVQYLRRLPENLFTNNLAPIFQRAMGSEQQLSMLKLLLGKLPIVNFCTIRALVRHLVRVSQHSDVNEMTAQNLSICVYTSMAQVMNALIVNCDYVFDQPEPGAAFVDVYDSPPPAFGLSN